MSQESSSAVESRRRERRCNPSLSMSAESFNGTKFFVRVRPFECEVFTAGVAVAVRISSGALEFDLPDLPAAAAREMARILCKVADDCEGIARDIASFGDRS